MYSLYIFTLLIHAAISTTPCQDGVPIITRETKNAMELIGNWTYVYHWDNLNKFNREFIDDTSDHLLTCPGISISAVTWDFIKGKKEECRGTAYPFDWSEARLRLQAPSMNMLDGILFMGVKENWLMLDCQRMVRVVINKVSDDYMVMTNPDVANNSEMIARKAVTLNELKCIAHNVDIGKGMSGTGLCY